MNFQQEPSKNEGSIMATTEGVVNSAKTGISNLFSGFSKQTEAGTGASNEFLSSNTIVAKFAFIILMVLLFVIGLYVGMMIIGYILGPTDNPYLVSGMIDGNFPVVIQQDPTLPGAVTLLRSNNANSGIEFTWSVWIRVDNLNATSSFDYSNIFNKGDTNYDATTGIAVKNAPGLYIYNYRNSIDSDHVRDNDGKQDVKLHFVMDDSDVNPQTIDVSNIPLGKWTNIAVRLENTMLDVYVNASIAARKTLTSVPNQNYYTVNVCQNGGFVGKLSNLRYFSTALSVFDLNNILLWGPNMSTSSIANTASSAGYGGLWNNPLSSGWYMNKV